MPEKERTEEEIKQELEDLSKARDVKCEPVAETVLEIIARHKPSASITGSDKDHDKMVESYEPIFKEIMELCLQKELTLSEIGYMMSIVKMFFDFTEQMVSKSITLNQGIAEKKVWGKEPRELTLKDLDDILKKK